MLLHIYFEGSPCPQGELCTRKFATICVPLKCVEQTMLPWQEKHPQVQRCGDPLPAFEAFKAKSAKMRSKTVQDVWGLMLTSVPGKAPFQCQVHDCNTAALALQHSVSQRWLRVQPSELGPRLLLPSYLKRWLMLHWCSELSPE